MAHTRLLKQTRDSVAILRDEHYVNTPWRTLVENCQDYELLHIVKECTSDEQTQLAYFGIALNRHQFIKWWWNRKALPQLDSDQMLKVLVALGLFKNSSNNPTNMLLAIVRSKALRKLYPQMLFTNSLTALRELLIEFVTRFPNGFYLLFKEWKKYTFSPKVWCFKIEYHHNVNYAMLQTLNVIYKCSKRSTFTTPLLQICSWGNIKDLCAAVHIPELWDDIIKPRVMACITKNTNSTVFNYFMELIWSAKKVCDQLPPEIGAIIWDNCYLKNIVSSTAISEALAHLNNKHHRDWKTRLRLLISICPETCTASLVTNNICKKLINQACPKMYKRTYYHWVPNKPMYANPEDLLLIEQQQPLLSPKADGTFFIGLLAPTCYPQHCIHETVRAEQMHIYDMNLYLVFDVYISGRWDERINYYARNHPYWKGPYLNLEQENTDLAIFLELAKENGWVNIWWPKGIYSGIAGKEYFHTLCTNPKTLYPNDGWIIAGNNGMLLKVKPREQLSLNLLYTSEHGWKCYGHSDQYTQIVDEFPADPPLPKNIPLRSLTNYINIFLQEQRYTDCCELIALNIQNVKLLSPTLLAGIFEQLPLINNTEFKTRYEWLLKTSLMPDKSFKPLELPNNWVSAYNGDRINDGVWRCTWDYETKLWKPYSRLYDKNKAHTYREATFLTRQYLYPWNPIQLESFYKLGSDTKLKPPHNINSLYSKQRKNIESFRNEHHIESFMYGDISTVNHFGYRWSVDIDPYVVSKQNWYGIHMDWCEPSNLCNPLTGEKYEKPCEYIAIQHAIHHIAENKEKWLSFVNLISDSRYLYITMIDADIIFKNSNTYTLPDGSSMERYEPGWHQGVWKGVTRLKWLGDDEQQHPFVSYSFIHQELIAMGWKNVGNTSSTLGLRLLYYIK